MQLVASAVEQARYLSLRRLSHAAIVTGAASASVMGVRKALGGLHTHRVDTMRAVPHVAGRDELESGIMIELEDRA